jgi:ABC-type transport system involved in multi-copper enzyme maturation permease subunit
MVDLGLSTILLGGMFLAAFTSAGVISREIENRTILTVISKPIARPVFIIGKFFGIATAVTLALAVWSILMLMSIRHGVMQTAADNFDAPVLTFAGLAILASLGIAALSNYMFKRHFGATLAKWLGILLVIAYLFVLPIGKDWSLQSVSTNFDPQMLAALFLLVQAIWLFCAVAVTASTRMGQVATLAVCAVVFFLGLCSDYVFGRFADTSAIAAWFYAVVPNLQVLWLADALTQQHPVNMQYVGLASAYSALFITALIGIAIALFQDRQVA